MKSSTISCSILFEATHLVCSVGFIFFLELSVPLPALTPFKEEIFLIFGPISMKICEHNALGVLADSFFP